MTRQANLYTGGAVVAPAYIEMGQRIRLVC